MTQVIHGLPRAELIKRVFGESKPPAPQRDSVPKKAAITKLRVGSDAS